MTSFQLFVVLSSIWFSCAFSFIAYLHVTFLLEDLIERRLHVVCTPNRVVLAQ